MKTIINDDSMFEYFNKIADNSGFIWEKILGDKFCSKSYGIQFNLSAFNINEKYNNLRIIFDEKDTQEQLCLIDNTLKIFSKYFNIEGLDRMLASNYTGIETDIFFEYNPKDGTPRKTRDHYKHQFRNAYLGSVLLLDYGFLDLIENSIRDMSGTFSEYIINSCSINGDGSYKEIIYKTYFLAALFHDIGYPLEFFMRKSEQIHNYSPFLKIVTPNIKTSYIEIKALLADSILFRFIDNENLKQMYEKNDHGALSAMSFLLNFYYSGSIYSLNTTDRCIIELAAVAIYKHTSNFTNGRMVFSDDPVSFLLRLCDDLQEWQRFSLLINENHNYLKCEKCYKIIRNDKDGHGDNKLYECSCGKQFEKITQIQNRKVNYINICDEIEISLDNDKKNININIKYDYYKQLELMLNDYTAVSYREKDLEKIKIMLMFQKYIPNINIEYFLSNNPIEILTKIIEDFKNAGLKVDDIIDTFDNKKLKNEANIFYKKYKTLKGEADNRFGNKIELNETKYCNSAYGFILENIGVIYEILSKFQFLLKQLN